MADANAVDIDEAMRKLDERLQSRTPKPRGRKQALAPYADQLRRYVEQGWPRKELVAEMRALGLSVSAATLRDVLGMAAPTPKRRPKPSSSSVAAKVTDAAPADAGTHGVRQSGAGW